MQLLAVLLFALAILQAGTPPANFTETTIVSGLSSPTAMAFAPDGRIFLLQQSGTLRIFKNGSLLATPALTLTVDSSGERGLLGIAFDPDFTTNQFIYLYYTLTTTPRRNRVSRFTMNGDLATAETVLLELDNLSSATNHNGGALHFGSDGKLYIAVGDNATASNAQTLANLHGKMLRMNKDGSIPADNPFFATATGKNRLIWTLGLRNPFTFAVQETTGRIFINDVGQNNWEEINDGIAGANYGWPGTEGNFNQASFPSFTRPTYAYNHANQFNGGFSCAITGGDFYNPANLSFPATYTGLYFFADFCGGWIATLNPTTGLASPFLTGGSDIVDIRIHPDGSLYYLQRGGGTVRRVAYTGPQAPTISTEPQNQTVPTGLNATFSVVANGSGLSYQWQRGTTNIPGATSATYTLTNVSTGDSGATFRVVVTNSTGSVTSNPATLTVTANQPPTASISAPATFIGGQTISFSGSATDPESGSLANSAFTWRVDYHTGAAVRPFVQQFSNAGGGSWVVPQITPYLLTDVFFRIHLSATDPQGNITSVSRDVVPVTSSFTVNTVPAGLSFSVDGVPFSAQQTIASVVGLIRPIATSTPQGGGGTRYNFLNWSDGGAISHNITATNSNTTYTANFATEYLLTTTANPPAGGTLTPGGFHAAGAIVNLSATANPGWQLANFSGQANGATVTMDAPKSVTANFTPHPTLLAVSVLSKTDSSGLRLWNLRVTNIGQGALANGALTSITITPIGSAAISLATGLPIPLGNIPPGGSVTIPVSFNWPLSTPPTRARMSFGFNGDFGHVSTVTLNNLFR